MTSSTNNKIGWLRSLFCSHLKRLLLFAAAGVPLTAIGLGLYYVEVSHLDANKFAVRPVNWVVLTGLGFMLNWLIWRERRSPKCLSGVKFYLVAVVCSGLSFSLFVLLTLTADLQYLLAQVVTGATVGLPHYIINDKGVFIRKSKTVRA
ncbi:hypothetical protein HYW36_02040 [Candidatus Saccharibacteria bacterium]|nr:hypothetical protein [Candidatus Saccharibacteria bacterium]